MQQDHEHDHKTTDDLVKVILDQLLAAAQRAAGVAAFDQEVINFWHNHYRAKFFYAIHVRGSKWDEAKERLAEQAAQLGAEAKSLAANNPITPREAALASLKVDCVPRKPHDPQVFYDWCN